ncbi:hypothetical protein A4A49_52232 [Nicotiana attenuata]|uniref:Uncharacterized protein n=1 Tax=Nicotiana attenuata TaxID=49451 RepID=A0A1J6ILN2_NICAT|nr:hypothetical protein A4A49_52232 [Nicotiana attenuata]
MLKLKNEYGLVCNRRADIRDVAESQWPGRFFHPELEDLAREICGFYMSKPIHVCQSNWEAMVKFHGFLPCRQDILPEKLIP